MWSAKHFNNICIILIITKINAFYVLVTQKNTNKFVCKYIKIFLLIIIQNITDQSCIHVLCLREMFDAKSKTNCSNSRNHIIQRLRGSATNPTMHQKWTKTCVLCENIFIYFENIKCTNISWKQMSTSAWLHYLPSNVFTT